ncbi:MAG: hypothetical protein ACTSWY_09330 [Promethearchaeota archaeon]
MPKSQKEMCPKCGREIARRQMCGKCGTINILPCSKCRKKTEFCKNCNSILI